MNSLIWNALSLSLSLPKKKEEKINVKSERNNYTFNDMEMSIIELKSVFWRLLFEWSCVLCTTD